MIKLRLYILLSLVIMMLLTVVQSFAADLNEDWTLRLNGKTVKLNNPLFINEKNNRIYISLRDVQERMGASVHADLKKKTVYISNQQFDTLSTREVDAWGRLVRHYRLPKNAVDYPYILKKYENEMYEMKYITTNAKRFLSARSLFTNPFELSKNKLDQLTSVVKQHYTMLLNVDHEKLANPEEWATKLFHLRSQGVNQQEAIKANKRYAQWVKDNRIRLKGEIIPESSMVYYSGVEYFIRCAVTFEITSFDTNKNILYDIAYDWNKLEKNKVYKGYVDIAIDKNRGSDWGESVKVSVDSSIFLNSKLAKQ